MRSLDLRQHSSLGLLAFFLILSVISAAPVEAFTDPDDDFWQPNSSLNGASLLVDALVMDGGYLYVGGHFEQIGGEPVHHLARWDGKQWSEVGGGVGMPMGGLIHRILVDGDNLYIAGCFTTVGGMMPVCNIAMWDGKMWDMMAGGTNLAVRAIAMAPNGDLYVGGEFTMAGGMPARGIARWDGQRWGALGSGVDHHVSSIAIDGNDVYAGGVFSEAGGEPANFVARWDGETWHPLGTGVNNLVTALALQDGDLYVGGAFLAAGGRAASRIARWDGHEWFPLGSGVSGPGTSAVREIFVDGAHLYVGGLFRSAGGSPANFVAMWDGSSWNPLGSGTDHPVKAFARHSNDVLFVGGEFRTAGGKPSNYLAHWTKPRGVPDYFVSFNVEVIGESVLLTWEVPSNESVSGFRVFRSDVGAMWEEELTRAAPMPPDARHYVDDRPLAGAEYEYVVRAVRPDGSEMTSQTMTVSIPSHSPLGLDQNYPNPFNPATTIRYTLPYATHVTLSVHDASGKLVKRLVDGVRAKGINYVTWDGRNQRGRRASSAIYFYRLQSDRTALTKKMILLK